MALDWSVRLLLLAMLLVMATAVAGAVEGRFFPVVERFEVTRTEEVSDTRTRVWGQFKLLRPGCDYRSLDWSFIGTNRNVGVPVDFEEGTVERGGGWNDFGPWVVQLTPEQLSQSRVIAFHACPWRWWDTITRLTD